jgi:hypothetical protein
MKKTIIVVVIIVAVVGGIYLILSSNKSKGIPIVPVDQPSVTINQSSLATTSAFPTITGTATNTSSLSIDINGSFPNDGSDSRYMLALYAGTVSVVNGTWSFTPSQSNKAHGGPEGLSVGTYTVTVGQTESSSLATGTLTVADTTSTDPTVDWKTYTNAKYGFQFSYPSTFTTLQEYPNNGQQECVPTEVSKGTSINAIGIASFSDGTLSVNLVCQSLTQGVVNSGINTFIGITKGDDVTTVAVAGKSSYRHELTTATGYHWIIIQIPLDSNHYIEMGYTFGNSDSLQGETPLSNSDWTNILASFKITK